MLLDPGQVCDDPALLHHLFVTYDMRWEVKLSAVQKITETFSGIISAALAEKPETPEEDVVANVSALYQAQSSSEGVQQNLSMSLRQCQECHIVNEGTHEFAARKLFACSACVKLDGA